MAPVMYQRCSHDSHNTCIRTCCLRELCMDLAACCHCHIARSSKLHGTLSPHEQQDSASNTAAPTQLLTFRSATASSLRV